MPPTPQPRPETKAVPDEAILRALVGGCPARNGGLITHQLFAPAQRHNTRLADLTLWYLTGPRWRQDYVEGPFPWEQIERLAREGHIVPAITAFKQVQTYELAEPQG